MRLIFAIILIAVTILIVGPNLYAQETQQTDFSSYAGPSSQDKFIDDQTLRDPAKIKELADEIFADKKPATKSETSNSLR